MEGGTALHLQDASPCCTTPLPTTLPRPSTTRWEVLSHSWFAFFFVGWLLQMDESLTVGLHRPVVVAQLGKPRHSRWPVTPPQLSDTTGKAASLSVVRHTATVVSGTTGKAGSLSVVSHTATVVGHNWESSCWLRMFSTRVAEHTSLMPHNCLSPPYCCRCIAAALPLHCRCIAAALLRLCCRSCPAALTAVVTATI